MEAIEIGKVAGLVNLVDIRLLGREMNVFADFVADIAEECVVDEILDDGMLVAVELVRKGRLRLLALAHTVATGRSSWYIPRVLCCRRDHRGSSYAPRRLRWLSSSWPCHSQALRFCVCPFLIQRQVSEG